MLGLMALRARSYVQENILQIGEKINLPDGNIVFLDIETDLAIEKVWQIQARWNNDHVVFLGQNYQKSEQRRILRQFIDFLKKIDNPILAMYSKTNFDYRVIFKILKNLKMIKESQFFSSLEFYDLCVLLQRSYILPNQSYALKEAGEFLGYPFSHKGMNGVRATLDFEECLRNKSPIPQKLVDYCRDDVMFMSWMLEY